MIRTGVLLLAVLALVGGETGPGDALVRIGDRGSLPDPTRFDERFPEMAEWARAGVEGGIPRADRIVATLKPGDDLQRAIDGAAGDPRDPGVILLQPGTHPFATTLRLKPGIILRGADRAGTVLAASLATGTCVRMAEWSALEDLTVLNQLVRERPESEYLGKYDNGGPSDACTISFGGSNAWLQRCDVLYAGRNPIEIHDRKANHITVRDCLIDKAYQKGGKGSGYFDISESSHVLIYRTTVRNIRHVSIMFNARHVVLYGCRIEVDINYHDGCPTMVLVERTTVQRRPGHHWSSICYGWQPWQDDGPGPRCFLWANAFDDGRGSGEQQVWVLRDTTPKYPNMTELEPMILPFGPPPKAGTLYAVTGRDIPAEEVERGAVWAKLQQAQRARDWKGIIQSASTAIAVFPADAPERAAATAALAEAERAADDALAKLRPTPAALRTFLASWKGTAAAQEATAIAVRTADEAWAKLGPEPSASQVRAHLADWDGVAPVAVARARLDALATVEWEKRKDKATAAQLQAFQKQWPGTAAAAQAAQRQTELLRTALADLVARKDRLTRKEREAAIDAFAGTPLEQEARAVLGR